LEVTPKPRLLVFPQAAIERERVQQNECHLLRRPGTSQPRPQRAAGNA
jgi:hypothetical protein